MTHPSAPRPPETDSEPLEPNGTIPFIPPTRRFPGVVRSWRPKLSETARKAPVRSSRVHQRPLLRPRRGRGERVDDRLRRVNPRGDRLTGALLYCPG